MMYDQQVARRILHRLTAIRAGMLGEYPFFGSLLMRLGFGIAKCETAYTDMKRIVFDPEFVDELDDEQLGFVLMHEVLHCALNHCYRSREFDAYTYNVACDIVVNSNIMKEMGVSEFRVGYFDAMHLAPDGKEGYLYTAEEVYYMLLGQNGMALPGQGKDDSMGMPNMTSEDGGSQSRGNADSDAGSDSDEPGICDGQLIDNHNPWKNLPQGGMIQDEWREIVVKESSRYAGTTSLPNCVRRLVEDLNYKGKIDWKMALREFISQHYDEYDYTYNPPDRRYIEYDMYLQSFRVQETEHVENLWFCVDTSGSISDEVLKIIFSEIKEAVFQWRGLKGKVSCFDYHVTEPEPFEDVEDLKKIIPKGGGGTSFCNIFHYMEEHMMSELPRGIVILTDGYAVFPKEEAAFGVPVLWIIIDSKEKVPWGTCVYVKS